jgi:hypothetical protein
MKRLGVELSGEAIRERHHDPRGGQLIAEAGRQHAENLAEGIVKSRDGRPGSQARQNLFHASNNSKRKVRLNAHG